MPLPPINCKEPLLDQMIKLVTNKLTGNSQFHGCHLWVNMPNVEMLGSSGRGRGEDDPLENYGISQVDLVGGGERKMIH